MFRCLETFLLLTLTICESSAGGCCPDAWTAFQGSCYLSHHTASNFHDAEDKCEELGGQLVHIETKAEDMFLKSFLAELKADNHWIGLQDGVIEGVWKWHGTDTVASFQDWDSGEPNEGTAANCVTIMARHQYHWVDEPCTNRLYRPLCERRANVELVG